jgi:CspA family cold shock protein
MVTRYTDGIVPDDPVRRSGARVRSSCFSNLPRFAAHDLLGGNQMATGTVKWFSDEKGFGFITPDDQGKDLFVHHTGIAGSGFKSLAEGARVSYDAENGPKGPNAVNVQTV